MLFLHKSVLKKNTKFNGTSIKTLEILIIKVNIYFFTSIEDNYN